MEPGSTDILIVGAGPAGLAAAEAAIASGRRVTLADAMPAAGRKFLVAGRGGLNLTHSEPLERFAGRYRGGEPRWPGLLADFGPDQIRAWAEDLGIPTYVGTSGRVFPVGNQAAALLLRWMERLRAHGVRTLFGHRFTGFEADGACAFETAAGATAHRGSATVLALGGASWPETGSDGAWCNALRTLGITVHGFKPSNCGFDADWPAAFAETAQGQPLKNIALAFGDRSVRGELLVTRTGLEGGALYQLSAELREAVPARVRIDLKPDTTAEKLALRAREFRGKGDWARRCRLAWKLEPAAAALFAGTAPAEADPDQLASHVKAVEVLLLRPRPLAEAISSAGGIAWEEVDDGLMLRWLPGVFAAGEMLDWEAPTGGYLLTGCMATGRRAGLAAAAWAANSAGTA
jgi:uncharacterized flavoprotein (TIGR03862 family)